MSFEDTGLEDTGLEDSGLQDTPKDSLKQIMNEHYLFHMCSATI